MNCNRNLKDCHYKTAEAVYNPNSQALTAASAALTLAGTVITDTGVGAEISGNNIVIRAPGLYFIAADMVAEATAAGDVSLQIALNGALLPSTLREVTAAAADSVSLHTEEILYIPVACGGAHPVINIAAAAAGAGTATLVTARLVKLA